MPKLSAAEKLRINQQTVKQLRTAKAPVKQLSENLERVNEMAMVYETALGIYKHKPALRYLKGLVKETDNVYKTWLRAVEFADELGVDFTTYVTAQFYYMDKWFNRAPKVGELASYKTKVNAKERVKMYLAETTSNKPVYGPSVAVKEVQLQPIKDYESEQSLKSLMKNFNKSSEEILRTFAKPETRDIYFNLNWLKKNEVYKKLQERGEV